jgi:hypothetical protein
VKDKINELEAKSSKETIRTFYRISDFRKVDQFRNELNL